MNDDDDDDLNEEEEEEEMAAAIVVQNNILLFQAIQMMTQDFIESSSSDESETVEHPSGIKDRHRHLPRPGRKRYDHEGAYNNIMRDYLSVGALISDFSSHFRISRSRFERMMQDFGNSDNPFYHPKYDAKLCASLEARLLLPLMCLAFGSTPKQARGYFSMSETQANLCCDNFDKQFRVTYYHEYLRRPTSQDLKAISDLHQKAHGVPGMLGSLDCCHTTWKNCPKAWHGSYKGRKKAASIVLEAACDYHLWFWHAAYGYAGCLNDSNILELSPLVGSFLDNSFSMLEAESGAVPFVISGQQFHQMYLLTDGIYPQYSRFVKGMTEPSTIGEKRLASWQAGARKDIERAFGVLQITWKSGHYVISHYSLLRIWYPVPSTQ